MTKLELRGEVMVREELTKLYGELFRSQFSFVPSGEHRLKDIYAMVKARYPDECDDTYRCRDHCSSNDPGPEWKHRVRSALNDLRQLETPPVSHLQRGLWAKT